MPPKLSAALPTVTMPPQPITILQAAAAYPLAFSITLAATAAMSDLSRLNLLPASVASPKNTNTISLEQQIPVVVSQSSWLETIIDRLLAQIPDSEWDKVPAIYVADIDQRM